MYAVATGVGADEQQLVACAFSTRAHEVAGPHKADTHRIDHRVLGVAVLEVDLAPDGRHAYAVAVSTDAGDHAIEVPAGFRQRTETQRVEQRDRPRAHGDDIAEDASHPGGRALVRLDGRRMVVGLDLENDSPPVAEADCAGVLTRALQHRRPARGQPAKQSLRRLVRAVLRPENAEHSKFDVVGWPLQRLDDDAVLVPGERDLAQLALVQLALFHSHRFDSRLTPSAPEPRCASQSGTA